MRLLRPFILLLCVSFALAETQITAPEAEIEPEDTTSALESEEHGIIPEGSYISTVTITPISMLPEKKAHEQGLEQLAIAQDLWKNGKSEAASDVALQAYDELMGVYLPRKKSKKSQKLRLERRQAATVYVEASIAYIQESAKKQGNTPEARKEGRSRLGDVWEVSRNYPELTKKLNAALNDLPSE